MNTLKDLFARAASHQPLTPQQRALLRLIVHGVLYQLWTGLVAAFQGVLVLFSQSGFQFNWGAVGGVALICFLCSLISAAQKYASAKGDMPLGLAMGALASFVRNHLPNIPSAALVSMNWEDSSNFILNMMHGMYLSANAQTSAQSSALPAPVVVASTPPPATSPSLSVSDLAANADYAG